MNRSKTLLKNILATVVVLLLLVGIYMLSMLPNKENSSQNTPQTEQQATQQSSEATQQPAQETAQPANEAAPPNSVSSEPSTNKYITVTEYNANTAQYSANKKVLFFHAAWCPICQGIEKEINADMSKIPTGTTIIKTDYDSNIDLRKKYGVTYQYTFVQIDNEGTQLKKWSASSLSKVLSQVQ